VQALAQNYNISEEQIPERYIRVEETAEEVIGVHEIFSAIPIINLNKLLDPESSKEECAKLGSACRQWGFFQVYKPHIFMCYNIPRLYAVPSCNKHAVATIATTLLLGFLFRKD
jgi:hypothetical protein